MSHILDCCLSFLLLGVLFVLPGYGLRAWLRRAAPEHDWLTSWMALGMTVWMGTVFLLATLQALSLRSVIAAALLFLGLAVRAWLRRPLGSAGFVGRPVVGRAVGERPTEEAEPRVVLVVLLVLGVLVLGDRFLTAMYPSVAWDASHYHLTVPRLYLEHGGFRRVPSIFSADVPFNIQMLFLLGLIVRDHVASTLVHFLLGLLLLLEVYQLCRRRTQAWVSLVAALLLLTNGVVLFELSVAYIDLGFAYFTLIAFRFLTSALEANGAGQRPRSLLFAGLFGGIAAGCKPVLGVLAVLALGAVHVLETRRDPLGWRTRLRELALVTVLPALLLLPWFIKSAVYNGNPFYPVGYRWFGGPNWSLELDARFLAAVYAQGMGRSPIDYLLLPVRVFLLSERGNATFDGHLSRAWLVWIPLALRSLGSRSPREGLGATGSIGACLLFSALYLAGWSQTSQQARYLIPMLPLLALAAGLGLGRLADGLPPGWLKRALPTLTAFSVVLLTVAAHPYGHEGTSPVIGELLRHGNDLRRQVVPEVYRFMDRTTSRQALVLMLDTNQGFFCPREYIADNAFPASQISWRLRDRTSPARIEALLDELKVTHVLRYHSPHWQLRYPAPFERYLEDPQKLRVVYRSADYTLLERR